jgi:hypothetical protein
MLPISFASLRGERFLTCMSSPQARRLVGHFSCRIPWGGGDEIVFKEKNWGAMLLATV